ncbi:TPA: hypothetical protein QCX65_005819 [Bacillus mycoides]|nr:hypothetical protein [Bacillus mycoides]
MGRMREIKFRYTFKHIGTGNIEKKIYTLKQLEERNTSELSPCFNKEFGYELVSRDQYTGEKDACGNEIYEGDIVYQTFYDRIEEGNGFTGVVKQEEGVWWIDNEVDNATRLWSEVNPNRIKGNKFESPELLQGGDKE